jgi:hypothetical protein
VGIINWSCLVRIMMTVRMVHGSIVQMVLKMSSSPSNRMVNSARAGSMTTPEIIVYATANCTAADTTTRVHGISAGGALGCCASSVITSAGTALVFFLYVAGQWLGSSHVIGSVSTNILLEFSHLQRHRHSGQ